MSITSNLSPAFRSGLGHPACASRGHARVGLPKQRHTFLPAHPDAAPLDTAVPLASVAEQPSSARSWLEENGPLALVGGMVVAVLGLVAAVGVNFFMHHV